MRIRWLEQNFIIFDTLTTCLKIKYMVFSGNIKAMELIMVDPGTVVGPNYSSKPICIECLKPGKANSFMRYEYFSIYQNMRIGFIILVKHSIKLLQLQTIIHVWAVNIPFVLIFVLQNIPTIPLKNVKYYQDVQKWIDRKF